MQARSWEGTIGPGLGCQGKKDWTKHQTANSSPSADVFMCISATCCPYAFCNFLMLKYGSKKLADIALIVAS